MSFIWRWNRSKATQLSSSQCIMTPSSFIWRAWRVSRRSGACLRIFWVCDILNELLVFPDSYFGRISLQLEHSCFLPKRKRNISRNKLWRFRMAVEGGILGFLNIRHNQNCRVVSSTRRPHFTLKEIPLYSYLSEAEWTLGLLNTDRKVTWAFPKDPKGNRTWNLQSYGGVVRQSSPLFLPNLLRSIAYGILRIREQWIWIPTFSKRPEMALGKTNLQSTRSCLLNLSCSVRNLCKIWSV
jgi:hypothetical protein